MEVELEAGGGSYDPAGIAAFLAARQATGCEEVERDALVVRRALALGGGTAVAELALGPRGATARLWLARAADREAAVAVCRRLLALDVPAAEADAVLGADPALGALVRAAPGRRLPGCVDGGELAVRAVLGQQVSVAAARTLASRLVARHGGPPCVVDGAPALRPFPTARALLDGMADDEPAMPNARRRALRAVLAAVDDGTLDLRPGVDADAARAALVALPGIGPWTAEYVVARALGEPDAWPPKDLGLLRGLEALGLTEADAPRWRPFRTFAMAHLWLA
ncbi:DNA-3-methyladenine glycosylase [Conexibacter sp. SYSU D00693]|uniref:DNA-3-methyladenine glycosylase family protein n=1 Tax=Conexibacter sp. SYSU D00693 TaxID=2812560 RepID=UPI001F121E4E|nr:AlkA N-terminal domain-containing protein [Conexibacter sp. SYSU D00693]